MFGIEFAKVVVAIACGCETVPIKGQCAVYEAM